MLYCNQRGCHLKRQSRQAIGACLKEEGCRWTSSLSFVFVRGILNQKNSFAPWRCFGTRADIALVCTGIFNSAIAVGGGYFYLYRANYPLVFLRCLKSNPNSLVFDVWIWYIVSRKGSISALWRLGRNLRGVTLHVQDCAGTSFFLAHKCAFDGNDACLTVRRCDGSVIHAAP